jgi:MFS family permease
MSPARALRVPAVLRDEPQFRLLFAGQALSVVGDRVSFIAFPFAVLASGGGLGEVGLVAAATSLPFLLFSLVAGVVADRRDRRGIMVGSDAVRFAAQAVAGGLVVSGAAEWWHLALIAFVYGSADAFFAPALYGLMPQIVRPANLQSANALRGLSMAVGMVGGPALAGLLLTLLDPGAALLVDAATFGASIVFLLRMRPGVPEAVDPVDAGLLAGLKGGWREVRSRTWVWSMLLGLASYHAIVLPSVFALGPVLAERDLGGPGAWALISGGFGVGSILGQLLLLRWRPVRPVRASAACLVFASMQAAIIGSGLPVPAIAALEAGAAVAVQAYFTLWETSIQEQIPAGAVSRVGSYDYFAATGMLPLGTAVTSAIGAAVGLRPTLIAMSVVGVAAALAVLSVPSVRHLRRPAVPL